MGRIESLHLEKNICMNGFCKNPYPYMKQAKVVLVTSDWEGFGIVTRETFILRTPVLLTDVGGMHELVLDYPEIGCDTEDEFVCKTKEILSESSEWKIVYDKIYKEQECQNNLQDYLNF
jgi:glycosyltransferase involved in cell wall biosynthesis